MDYHELKQGQKTTHTAPPGASPQPPPKKHVCRYDIYGPVAHVLRKIDRYVPQVFPEKADAFLASLKDTIKKNAAQHGWEIISLTLSQGLAAKELDDILDHEMKRQGPMVIDPTACASTCATYLSSTAIKVDRNQLVKVNVEADDVLIVLFGLEKMDAETSKFLLMRRLRMAGHTFELLTERDPPGVYTPSTPSEPRVFPREFQLLREAKRKLMVLTRSLSSTELENVVERNDLISGELFIILSHLYITMGMTRDPYTYYLLNNIVHQLIYIPEQYRELNLSYHPFAQTGARVMQQHLTERPAITPPPPSHSPHPHHEAVRPGEFAPTLEPH